jgi:hypothetical protein
VNYEIVEIEQFSGSEAKVYSIIPEGDEITLYDRFIEGHKNQYKGELKQINNRLKQIGHYTGARENYFKQEGDHEFVRKYGNYVYALYDEEDSNLRLYCIRFSTVAIILGGGGFKDKSVVKWQESKELSEEVEKIMAYAASIIKQIDEEELYWSDNGSELLGNLKNYNNEDDE